MWNKFIVHLGGGVGTVCSRNRVDTFFPFPIGYANVTLWQWLVSSRESRVTRVTGQLTDGSRGSWVVKCDPLSALEISYQAHCHWRQLACGGTRFLRRRLWSLSNGMHPCFCRVFALIRAERNGSREIGHPVTTGHSVTAVQLSGWPPSCWPFRGEGGGAPVPIFLFLPGWQAGASSVFAVLFALRIRLAAGNLFLVCIANDGLTLRRRRAADCVRGGCMHSWSIDMPLCLSSYSCLWKALPHQSEILTLTLFAAHT